MSGVVWLVGMMGAGKSAIGAVVAERLGRPFVDTDACVERASGRPIARIFAEDGEAAFRRLEAEAIERAARRPAVVALGGGAIAQPGAPERLAATGVVVYLRARPERLAERTLAMERASGAPVRPLLAGLGREARVERLREILARREAAYATAVITVDSDDAPVERVADEVVRRVRRWEERSGRAAASPGPGEVRRGGPSGASGGAT